MVLRKTRSKGAYVFMKTYYMLIRGENELIEKCYKEVAPMITDKNNIKKYLHEIELWSVSSWFMKDLQEHLKVIFDNKLSIQYL